MKHLRYLIPVVVIIIITALTILSALWLTSLVPNGEWAGLIKAAIVVFIIGSTLFILAWSAYFTFIVRESVLKNTDLLK